MAQLDEMQSKRGKGKKKKIKPTDILKPAAIPSEEEEKMKLKPKGLPSHWGPKVNVIASILHGFVLGKREKHLNHLKEL